MTNLSDQSSLEQNLSEQMEEQVESAKATITEPLPSPPGLSGTQASPQELLKRLNWGEPALTIIDVRSREAFNAERITGAVPMPMEDIPESAKSTLEYKRDLYVYGDNDENAIQAANQLRQAGYVSVAMLQGGLSQWKAIKGPTEGIYAFSSPAKAEGSSRSSV
jgi:rhodanese-related sulfurtransferase